MPVDTLSVTFLGTVAGRPCATRNVSSLVVRLDSRLWMVDAGEGTQHRLLDARCKKLAMSKIARIFVTHMHGRSVGRSGVDRFCSRADTLKVLACSGPRERLARPVGHHQRRRLERHRRSGPARNLRAVGTAPVPPLHPLPHADDPLAPVPSPRITLQRRKVRPFKGAAPERATRSGSESGRTGRVLAKLCPGGRRHRQRGTDPPHQSSPHIFHL
jgi:hypothetical protein